MEVPLSDSLTGSSNKKDTRLNYDYSDTPSKMTFANPSGDSNQKNLNEILPEAQSSEKPPLVSMANENNFPFEMDSQTFDQIDFAIKSLNGENPLDLQTPKISEANQMNPGMEDQSEPKEDKVPIEEIKAKYAQFLQMLKERKNPQRYLYQKSLELYYYRITQYKSYLKNTKAFQKYFKNKYFQGETEQQEDPKERPMEMPKEESKESSSIQLKSQQIAVPKNHLDESSQGINQIQSQQSVPNASSDLLRKLSSKKNEEQFTIVVEEILGKMSSYENLEEYAYKLINMKKSLLPKLDRAYDILDKKAAKYAQQVEFSEQLLKKISDKFNSLQKESNKLKLIKKFQDLEKMSIKKQNYFIQKKLNGVQNDLNSVLSKTEELKAAQNALPSQDKIIEEFLELSQKKNEFISQKEKAFYERKQLQDQLNQIEGEERKNGGFSEDFEFNQMMEEKKNLDETYKNEFIQNELLKDLCQSSCDYMLFTKQKNDEKIGCFQQLLSNLEMNFPEQQTGMDVNSYEDLIQKINYTFQSIEENLDKEYEKEMAEDDQFWAENENLNLPMADYNYNKKNAKKAFDALRQNAKEEKERKEAERKAEEARLKEEKTQKELNAQQNDAMSIENEDKSAGAPKPQKKYKKKTKLPTIKEENSKGIVVENNGVEKTEKEKEDVKDEPVKKKKKKNKKRKSSESSSGDSDENSMHSVINPPLNNKKKDTAEGNAFDPNDLFNLDAINSLSMGLAATEKTYKNNKNHKKK
ncbi:MAG: hypothetical protein MJ252_22210 [archaeon]|nr:hypothetical protein [archaeon]